MDLTETAAQLNLQQTAGRGTGEQSAEVQGDLSASHEIEPRVSLCAWCLQSLTRLSRVSLPARRCERCGNDNGKRYGSVALCPTCLYWVVLDWKSRQRHEAAVSAVQSALKKGHAPSLREPANPPSSEKTQLVQSGGGLK